MSKLQLVKLLVFCLSFAIIFGMILAGRTIYQQVKRAGGDKMSSMINLNQPQGSSIVDYKTDAGIVVIHLKGGRLGERLISVDVKGKNVLSTITLN